LRGRGPDSFDDATLFLRAFGHGVIAWLWLDQALVSAGLSETAYRTSLSYACRYFFETELPQAHSWLSIVAGHSTLARSMPSEALA
jgi:hypothetical protein